MTRWLSLPASTWVGRLVTWGLLAWAWRRLSVAIVPLPLYSVLSAGLFVAGTSRLHMAGEWIIGGFEAKGLAYVLVLLALEAVVRNRWQWVWPLLGLASTFHVVVGAWSVLAAGLAWLMAGSDRPAVGAMLKPLLLGLLFALPGLLPALELSRGVEPWVAREANRIYVYERLSHHLVPQLFPIEFIRRHLLLWLLWGVLCWLAPFHSGERRLRWVVGGTIAIAIMGFLVAALTTYNRAIAAAILRYYWFRMTDIFVPLGAALHGDRADCRSPVPPPADRRRLAGDRDGRGQLAPGRRGACAAGSADPAGRRQSRRPRKLAQNLQLGRRVHARRRRVHRPADRADVSLVRRPGRGGLPQGHSPGRRRHCAVVAADERPVSRSPRAQQSGLVSLADRSGPQPPRATRRKIPAPNSS